MTTALGILVVLAAWTVLPFPLAVLVGRHLGSRAADGPEAADVAPRPDLTLA
jgi:hypothetical protein